jgi:uncharacterized protein (TIGR03067 family)
MYRLISATGWLILASAILAGAGPAAAQTNLQGSWTAAKAERDGKAAEDVIGHRLVFAGNRFEIRANEGKLLYSGTVRVNSTASPVAIDFEHKQGSLNGKQWKGIYTVEGDTLTIIDNAPDLKKPRPVKFEAGSGSGFVLITFTRTKR